MTMETHYSAGNYSLGYGFGGNYILAGLLMGEKEDPTGTNITGTYTVNSYPCTHGYFIPGI